MTFLHRWDKALWPSCEKAKSRSMTGLHNFWKHKETAVSAWGYLCRSSVCVSHLWPWAPTGDTYYLERYLLPGALLQPPFLPLWLGCHSNYLISSFAGSDFVPCGCSILFPHPGLRCATYSTHSDTHLYYLFNMGSFSHESPEEVKHKSHTQTLLLVCWGFFPYSERDHKKS